MRLFVSVRGECTESLRRRISELETEYKKLTLDIKVKEEQIREMELKVQVRRCLNAIFAINVSKSSDSSVNGEKV